MAATTFQLLDSVKLAMGNSPFHLSSSFLVGVAHSANVNLNLDTSTQASMTSITLSGDANYRKLGPAVWTKSADGVLKLDLSDINLTASSGVTLSAKFGVVLSVFSLTEASVQAGTASMAPIGYFTLSSGSSVVASQINITWPAAGLVETSDNV